MPVKCSWLGSPAIRSSLNHDEWSRIAVIGERSKHECIVKDIIQLLVQSH